MSERACVYWNTTAGAWRQDGFWDVACMFPPLISALWSGSFQNLVLFWGCGSSACRPTRTRVATRRSRGFKSVVASLHIIMFMFMMNAALYPCPGS